MEHGTNVVVVSIQYESSKKILLFADWLFTTTTFVRCSICHPLIIGHYMSRAWQVISFN